MTMPRHICHCTKYSKGKNDQHSKCHVIKNNQATKKQWLCERQTPLLLGSTAAGFLIAVFQGYLLNLIFRQRILRLSSAVISLETRKTVIDNCAFQMQIRHNNLQQLSGGS